MIEVLKYNEKQEPIVIRAYDFYTLEETEEIKNVEIIVIDDFDDDIDIDLVDFLMNPTFPCLKEIQLKSIKNLCYFKTNSNHTPIIRILKDGEDEETDLKNLCIDDIPLNKVFFNDRPITLNEAFKLGGSSYIGIETLKVDNPLIIDIDNFWNLESCFFENKNIKEVLFEGTNVCAFHLDFLAKRPDLLLEKDGNLYLKSNCEFTYLYKTKNPKAIEFNEKLLLLNDSLNTDEAIRLDLSKYSFNTLLLNSKRSRSGYKAHVGQGSHIYLPSDCTEMICDEFPDFKGFNIHFDNKKQFSSLSNKMKFSEETNIYIGEDLLSIDEKDLSKVTTLNNALLKRFGNDTIKIDKHFKSISSYAFKNTKIKNVIFDDESEIKLDEFAFESADLNYYEEDGYLYLSSENNKKFLLVKSVDNTKIYMRPTGFNLIAPSFFLNASKDAVIDLSGVNMGIFDPYIIGEKNIKALILPKGVYTIKNSFKNISNIYLPDDFKSNTDECFRRLLGEIYLSGSMNDRRIAESVVSYESQEDYAFNFHRGSMSMSKHVTYYKDEDEHIHPNVSYEEFLNMFDIKNN